MSVLVRHTVILLLLAVGVGAVVGLHSRPVAATHNGKALEGFPVTLAWGGWPMLTTGWHSDGVSLDWDDDNAEGGAFAYFRGIAFAPTNGLWGYAHFYGPRTWGGCKAVPVDIYDHPSNQYAGTIWLVHTQVYGESGRFVWLQMGPSWVANDYIAATNVAQDNPGCPFTGSHTHETRGSISDFEAVGHGTWTENLGRYPTGNYCQLPNCTRYQNSDAFNWTREVDW